MAPTMDDKDTWTSSDDSDDDCEEDIIEESLTFQPLCCAQSESSASFDSLAVALQHDVDVYGFDLLEHLPCSTHDDFFEASIVLVNKSRAFVLENITESKDIGTKLSAYLTSDDGEQDQERFFRPVLNDDAILMSIDDLQILKQQRESNNLADNNTESAKETLNHAEAMSGDNLQMRISSLEEQLARAKACIASLTTEETAEDVQKRKKKRDVDTYYFSSYSHHDIHETMLKDEVRTKAYQEAILSNPQLFKDKIVLDIGCGTGVLSIFAARAGASKVIAIDGSNIIKEAQKIVAINGHDNVIHCVQGKVEDLIANKALPLQENEKIDVIVSEWMGYALLFETMLPSVMVARDSLGGTMFPNVAKMYLEGASDPNALGYWNDVHGIDMTPMKTRVAREMTEEASVEIVPSTAVVTSRAELMSFDLNTCRDHDLDFSVPFELTAKTAREQGSNSNNATGSNIVSVDKLVVSFDIDFNIGQDMTHPVKFSTGCQSKPTHWKQTTLWFDPMSDGIPTTQGELEVMRGTFQMRRNKENHRDMDFKVVWEVGRKQADGKFVKRRDGTLNTKLCA